MEKTVKKSKRYWGKETQDAIVKYNKTKSIKRKNIIYTNDIHPKFKKITEIIAYRYFGSKITKSMQDEVITKLYEQLPLYNAKRGTSYSFFGTVAKNEFHKIVWNKKGVYKNNEQYPDNLDFDNTPLMNIDDLKKFQHNTPEFLDDYYAKILDYLDYNNFKDLFISKYNIELKSGEKCRIFFEALHKMFNDKINLDDYFTDKNRLYPAKGFTKIFLRAIKDNSNYKHSEISTVLKKIRPRLKSFIDTLQ